MCFPENTNQNYFVLARKFFLPAPKRKKSRATFLGALGGTILERKLDFLPVLSQLFGMSVFCPDADPER